MLEKIVFHRKTHHQLKLSDFIQIVVEKHIFHPILVADVKVCRLFCVLSYSFPTEVVVSVSSMWWER